MARWYHFPFTFAAFFSPLLIAACREALDERADFAAEVRATYRSNEFEAFAAWETAAGPERLLAVAVRALPPYDAMLRVDFWMDDVGGEPYRYARSEVFPDVNEIDVTQFVDLTGDGVPDLAAEIIDTLTGARPILLLGARGTVDDLLDRLDDDWAFAVGPPNVPEFGGCAIKIWTLEPTPDSMPAGWRYLPVSERGVGDPIPRPPDCSF